MIRRIISCSAQPQLIRNIQIPLLARSRPDLTDLVHDILVPLPRRPAERTRHATARQRPGAFLLRRPLLEALLVDVVAACGFAVDDFLGGWGEVHAADGAVVFDGFADGVVGGAGGGGFGRGSGRCFGQDLLKLGGQEGGLVLQLAGGFEDEVEDLDGARQWVIGLQCSWGG